MTAILYQTSDFWVCKERFGSGRLGPKSNGYAVYRNGITHSTRVAQIGFDGEEGLRRAIAEADRRVGLVTKTITTSFDHPPIPDRSHDYSAIFNSSYDYDAPIGRGPTREAAIIDLLQQAEGS